AIFCVFISACGWSIRRLGFNFVNVILCKRLNFREDLIFANFANCLRFAKNSSREQFGQYVNTTEATFDSRKLEPANNFKFSALGRFAKI
ncbi:MAG: hypothetical protein PV344_04935, partial [Anaplasma sp.]|nr:hypothetical protein [Anaplasma sp.]